MQLGKYEQFFRPKPKVQGHKKRSMEFLSILIESPQAAHQPKPNIFLKIKILVVQKQQTPLTSAKEIKFTTNPGWC